MGVVGDVGCSLLAGLCVKRGQGEEDGEHELNASEHISV